jgi:hypothetical protein
MIDQNPKIQPLNDESLSEKSLRIASEKPRFWEYKLFAQSLVDQISLSKAKINNEDFSNLGISESVPFLNTPVWLNQRIDELRDIVHYFMRLLNHDQLIRTFGSDAQPGNVDLIIMLTKAISKGYEDELNICNKLQHTYVDSIFEPLLSILTDTYMDSIKRIEMWGSYLTKQLNEIYTPMPTDERKAISIMIEIFDPYKSQMIENELSSVMLILQAETNPEIARHTIPDDVKIFVWNRDGGRCVKCGSQVNLEFDHIIPIAKGGSNTARNIQILCDKCNRIKGADLA